MNRSERLRAQDALQNLEAQNAFLLQLSDARRPLSDANEIHAVVTRSTLNYFNADRCYYCEIVDGTAVIRRDAARGDLPSVVGEYSLSNFPLFEAMMASGAPLIVEDANTTDLVDEALKRLCVQMQIVSFINVPVQKEGRYVGNFCITQSAPRNWTTAHVELAQQIAERTWDAVERARAEEALRVSEAKYRTLFNSIDEGFCVFGLIYDENEKAVDYRFLEVNHVFERQTGLKNAVGKLNSDVAPNTEAQWLETYDHVARTGEPVRLESYHQSTGRWYEVYASRMDGPGSRQVCTVFNDITERKRAEEQREFLSQFSDAIRSTETSLEIQQVGMRMLGEHLNATRAFYFFTEPVENGDWIHIIETDYLRDFGMHSHAGRHFVSNFGLGLFEGAEHGKIVAIEDVTKVPMLTAAEIQNYLAVDVMAFINVPLIKNGKFVAGIGAHDSAPRLWKPAEIALIQEVAARTWSAVERARSEEALRASEEQYRLFTNAVSDILYKMNADWSEMRLLVGKSFLADTDNPSFTWLERYIPDADKALVRPAIAEAIRTKTIFELEHRVVRADGTTGWASSRAIPLLDTRGEIIEWFGAASDITERKESEEALRASEGRLQALIENLPGGAVFVVDQNLRYLVAEGEALAAAGFAPHELVGRSIGEAMPMELVPLYETMYRKAFAGEAFEHEHTAHNRAYISRGVPLYTTSGNIYAVLAVSYDITERKRAEAAVHESEGRLRLATEVGGIGTWEWNLKTNEIFCNEQYFLLFGMEPRPNPLKADDFFQHVHPNDLERIKGLLEKAIAERGVFATDFCIVLDSGETRWMSGYGRVFEEAASGEPTKMSGLMFDSTARKQMEEAVRESETRLQTLADAVPQVIWTNTADGVANYFNRRWYDYSGLTYEQSVGRGRGWQAIVHPDDAPASSEKWDQALAAGDVFDAEYRLRGADGTYRWFLGRNIPLKDASGSVTGWFGSATDVEDWKQAQTARQESEERFRILVEGAQGYAMFLLDPNGRITFWSKGAERVFGWTEAEVLGQSGAIIFTAEDRAAGAPERELKTALNNGTATDRRWHLRKNGTRFWADGLLMRLDDANGKPYGFAKVARDATDQKRSEEAVQAALEAVAQANETLELRVQERTLELTEMGELRQELLRQLVSAQEEERAKIARDLHDDTGQQVTGLLLGLAALKSREAVAGDAGAQSAVADLQGLANDIAQKSHRIALNLRPTALDDIGLMQALKNYAEQWSSWSGLPLEVDGVGMETDTGEKRRLAPEIETTIYRIAQEALTNVLRHATGRRENDAGRKPARHVSVLVQWNAHDVLTIIEDDGPGFDVEAVLNVPPGSRRLGIFGMQERARLAGGTLEIEASPGEGTTLYLRIPLPPAGKEVG